MDRPIILEPMTGDHWASVRSIYLEGIATGNETFQQTAPEWKEWDEGHLRICRMIARTAQEIVGWAALSAVSKRPVYAGVTEVSIYVAEMARKCGVGKKLVSRLIADSEAEGIWTLQAGILREHPTALKRRISSRRYAGTTGQLKWPLARCRVDGAPKFGGWNLICFESGKKPPQNYRNQVIPMIGSPWRPFSRRFMIWLWTRFNAANKHPHVAARRRSARDWPVGSSSRNGIQRPAIVS
ncbi:MAG TPA: GNAT family N-acetyltransferase [Candidatus Acidoferrales bacterium]